MGAAHVGQGHIALPLVRNDLWLDERGDPTLQKPPAKGSRAPNTGSKEDPIRAHEELFTSGEYVHEFQPEARHNPFARDYARKREAVIRAVTGTDRRVLDVGGGMGRMSVPLSRTHFVTLTDISSQMLELARPAASERLRLQVADARALPFDGGEFDYVLCIDVLPHIPEPRQLLQEVVRMLKPGGTLVIDITNSWPLWTLAYPSYLGRRPRRWLQIWRSGGVLPEWSKRVRHHRRRQLVDMLCGSGLRIQSVRGFGPRLCPKWHLAVAVKG